MLYQPDSGFQADLEFQRASCNGKISAVALTPETNESAQTGFFKSVPNATVFVKRSVRFQKYPPGFPYRVCRQTVRRGRPMDFLSRSANDLRVVPERR
jgi:hypothetical protein